MPVRRNPGVHPGRCLSPVPSVDSVRLSAARGGHGRSAHPRARRRTRRRRSRSPGFPRRPARSLRWVPGGRHLLRPFRLPDHVAPPRRVAANRTDRTAGLLGAPRAEAASGAARAADRCRAHGLVHRPSDRGGPPAGRRPRGAVLRRQLADDRARSRLLHPDGGTVAAPAHLVLGHRGAVLPPVAPAPPCVSGCARLGAAGPRRDLGRVRPVLGRHGPVAPMHRIPPGPTTAPTPAPPPCCSAPPWRPGSRCAQAERSGPGPDGRCPCSPRSRLSGSAAR